MKISHQLVWNGYLQKYVDGYELSNGLHFLSKEDALKAFPEAEITENMPDMKGFDVSDGYYPNVKLKVVKVKNQEGKIQILAYDEGFHVDGRYDFYTSHAFQCDDKQEQIALQVAEMALRNYHLSNPMGLGTFVNNELRQAGF